MIAALAQEMDTETRRLRDRIKDLEASLRDMVEIYRDGDGYHDQPDVIKEAIDVLDGKPSIGSRR